MASRCSGLIIAFCLAVASGTVAAQTAAGDITFKVPVNLTKLSIAITKVAVECRLQSNAILFTDASGQQTHDMKQRTELPVTGGQIVTTASVVFTNFSLQNPAGTTASYECLLLGYTAQTGWSQFSDSAQVQAFRVTPTPAPLPGSFQW